MVNEKEIKDYYNKRHKEKGTNAWRPSEAYRSFLDYLKVESGKKLLDVACGTGYLLKNAQQRGLETYGVDISEEAVKIAQKNSPNSKIKQSRGEELDFSDGFFDYVTCLGALEHFLNMDKGLNEMLRVAKDDAMFCIMVPNSNYFYFKISGKPGTEQYDINETLLSLEQWQDMFNKKFEILKVYQDYWRFSKIKIFDNLNPIKICMRFLVKYLYFLIPLKSTFQFVFIMKQK